MDLASFAVALLGGILIGILIGMFSERHRLHEFVKREREWATQQTVRADKAVDQLILQSGGTPISALAQAEEEQRNVAETGHRADQDEIFAEETGTDPGPEEPPE